jgi:hypothetical protein
VTFYALTMLVESIRLRLVLIAPLRLALGIVWVVLARVDGARSGAALIAFIAGAFASAFLVTNDPLGRFRKTPGRAAELPADATVAPAWLHALHAAIPSTAGISVLAALTLLFQPALTALLAGLLTGMGVVALLAVYGMDGRLYLDPRTGGVFRKAR